MSALTKEKLADTLITQLNFEKKEAMHFVKLFYDELVFAFVQGESVHLSGFGNFDINNISRFYPLFKRKYNHFIRFCSAEPFVLVFFAGGFC